MSKEEADHLAANMDEEEDKGHESKKDKKIKHQDHHTGMRQTNPSYFTIKIHELWKIGEFCHHLDIH